MAQLFRHLAHVRAGTDAGDDDRAHAGRSVRAMRSVTTRVHLCSLLLVLVCSSSAFAQTEQVRLKLADGSYLTVDDAWESSQGVWYRQGGLSHLLAKEKVKKIERTT